jgi:hypothetical protein
MNNAKDAVGGCMLKQKLSNFFLTGKKLSNFHQLHSLFLVSVACFSELGKACAEIACCSSFKSPNQWGRN